MELDEQGSAWYEERIGISPHILNTRQIPP